jgi:hypothetical protein
VLSDDKAVMLHWAKGDLLLNVQFDGENAGKRLDQSLSGQAHCLSLVR